MKFLVCFGGDFSLCLPGLRYILSFSRGFHSLAPSQKELALGLQLVFLAGSVSAVGLYSEPVSWKMGFT